MEFLQVVDPQLLAPASTVRVAVELLAVALFAVVLGLCLRIAPERLVPRSKTRRPQPALQPPRHVSAAAPKPVATVPAKPTTTAAAPPTSAAAAAAAAPQKPTSAPAAAPPSTKADATLDDVLDSFFDDEDLLDEALLDTAAPTTEPPPNPATNSPKPTPDSPTAKSQSTTTKPAAVKAGGDVFSKELAAKMTKGLQSKAPALAPAAKPAPTPAVKTPPPAAATAEQELDDVLDAYMAEEQLLDEAILDSAVKEAQN